MPICKANKVERLSVTRKGVIGIIIILNRDGENSGFLKEKLFSVIEV